MIKLSRIAERSIGWLERVLGRLFWPIFITGVVWTVYLIIMIGTLSEGRTP